MPVIKVYVTDEQAEAIKAYAEESDRSVSNLLLTAITEKAVRTKKHYQDGSDITIPKKARSRLTAKLSGAK